jgi:hypothetical protein
MPSKSGLMTGHLRQVILGGACGVQRGLSVRKHLFESRTFLARKGLNQDVSSADESGIALVIAGDTSKHLSLAVAPIVLTTSGTCSGGAFSDRRQSVKHGFPRPDIRSAASPAGRSKGRRLCGSSFLWFARLQVPTTMAQRCHGHCHGHGCNVVGGARHLPIVGGKPILGWGTSWVIGRGVLSRGGVSWVCGEAGLRVPHINSPHPPKLCHSASCFRTDT